MDLLLKVAAATEPHSMMSGDLAPGSARPLLNTEILCLDCKESEERPPGGGGSLRRDFNFLGIGR